ANDISPSDITIDDTETAGWDFAESFTVAFGHCGFAFTDVCDAHAACRSRNQYRQKTFAHGSAGNLAETRAGATGQEKRVENCAIHVAAAMCQNLSPPPRQLQEPATQRAVDENERFPIANLPTRQPEVSRSLSRATRDVNQG